MREMQLDFPSMTQKFSIRSLIFEQSISKFVISQTFLDKNIKFLQKWSDEKYVYTDFVKNEIAVPSRV